MDIIKVIIIKANIHEAQDINDVLEMHCPYVKVIGIANDIIGMQNLIANNNYDLIILGLNTGIDFGFECLKNSTLVEKKELIIINTNKKQNALTYINCESDGVLRSIDSTQIIVAIHKAKEHLFSKSPLLTIKPNNSALTQIGIPSLKEVKIINVKNLLYLKSEGKYTSFCLKNNNEIFVSSRNLGEYEKQLAHNNFLRIHNSYLVNMDNVVNVQKKDGIYLKMNNNEHVPVSKRKKEVLFNYLGIK
jgi:two-component system, LytTR family, response regulator